MTFTTHIRRALLVSASVAFLTSVISQGQRLSQGRRTGEISGTWAVGSISADDVSLDEVEKLLETDAENVGVTVCDFAFADIAGDGLYRLLVAVDYSGRRWCNHLEIISRDGKGREIEVWNVEHIQDILVRDGGHDLLRVPQAITDYEGINCIAVVPIFYKFSGESIVVDTDDHATDYRELRKKLPSAPKADVCSTVEADKLDRLLGDKTAGFAHAMAWLQSLDPSLRRKAVRVFEDIGDAESQSALRILAGDKDPTVSTEASYALRQ